MTSSTRILKLGGAIALALGVVVAFGGCSSSSSTPASNGNRATSAPDRTQASEATPASNSGGLSDAASAFSNITSFQFSITMQGGTYGSMLGDAPISGTIVLSPEKASDITIMGMEIREVGGKSYVNMGATWVESQGDSSTTSMADDFAPDKLFGSYMAGDLASDYTLAGEEQKNGVNTLHYTASTDALTAYGSMMGVEGGTWTADVWIAKDGGYPVSMKIEATGGTDDDGNPETFLFAMDITHVNDPANVITAP
jgi:hypothetical protein